MATLELSHITKSFRPGEEVLTDVSFRVENEEFAVILGPSGCGKTTLLRIIAGLEVPTKGDVLLEGKRINKLSPDKRNLSMVFQNYALYPHMSVFHNLEFGLKMQGISLKERKRKVDEVADMLSIRGLLNKKPRELSGGERQRVALGRAVVRDPQVFLFDEPLSNLDAKLRTQLRVELKNLHRRLGRTSCYVTHDQIEAMTLGDKIVVLNRGNLQQIADPYTIYEYPKNRFVAEFVGVPAMNFFSGELARKEGKLYFQNQEMDVPIPREKAGKIKSDISSVYLGIRPEAILLEGGEHNFCFKTELCLKESLGHETLLHYRRGEFTITVKTASHPISKTEQEIYFDLTKIHLFSSLTGDNLIL